MLLGSQEVYAEIVLLFDLNKRKKMNNDFLVFKKRLNDFTYKINNVRYNYIRIPRWIFKAKKE